MAGWITKTAPFGFTGASGTIVAAVANAQIRLIGYHFTVSDAVSVQFEGVDGKDLTGALPAPVASGGWGMSVPPAMDSGWGDTNEGDGLKITLGSSATIGGVVIYQERA